MTKAVTELLRQFKGRGAYSKGAYSTPKLAQFDDSKEFYNVGVTVSHFWKSTVLNSSPLILIRNVSVRGPAMVAITGLTG